MIPDFVSEFAPSIRPAAVTIPAGEFWMGESEGDKFANDTERPRHLVRIARPFRLAVFPVTRALLRGRVADSPADDLPATGVSWTEAVAFCRALGGRLPSEAEWEYAARAGTLTPFPGGFDLRVSEANFLYSEHGERIGLGRTTPAGTHPPNAFGLEAMAGNVCEWCADAWHPDYVNAPVDGSARTDGRHDLRVIRGGAWDYLPRLLRSSWRDALPASTRRDNVGFRVAWDLP